MIRQPYRSLLNNGRTYAAFEKRTILPLIENLRQHSVIADPMAGFGGLMNLCTTKGISTLNIEYNPPSYLWMVAMNPANSKIIIKILDNIDINCLKSLEGDIKAEISSSWFTEKSKEIIISLYNEINKIAVRYADKSQKEELSLAILLPFVGRLSSFVPGEIVTHIKEGGICIYRGLREDFLNYIVLLRKKLDEIPKCSKERNQHVLQFGDLRTIKIRQKVTAFITSPPYPNGRDYNKMFAPENECLKYLQGNKIIEGFTADDQLVGSPIVSRFKNKNIQFKSELLSESAIRFLSYIQDYNGSKQAKYDNSIYYLPYFSNYFLQIQDAYYNFIQFLDKDCEGYIVAVNNTARNKVIPVAESIVEIFIKFGFIASICGDYTRELFHIGSINPRAKGFRAKHMEYIIKVRRERKV